MKNKTKSQRNTNTCTSIHRFLRISVPTQKLLPSSRTVASKLLLQVAPAWGSDHRARKLSASL